MSYSSFTRHCLEAASVRGYRLSKPINTKITDLSYVDDLKVYAASEAKLKVVLREVQAAMGDIGLLWNERKCTVVNAKRGCLQDLAPGLKIGKQQLIKSLTEDSQYKFLGVLESIKQEDSLVLESVARVYLQTLSVIWSSPLSDHYKVVATNQFALPVLAHFMWTQVWPITELQRLNRESRKIMVENGGNTHWELVTCSISQGELEVGDFSQSKRSTSSLRSRRQ